MIYRLISLLQQWRKDFDEAKERTKTVAHDIVVT